MARSVKNVHHAEFRQFTKQLAGLRRQLRSLEPDEEQAPRETSVIHDDEEQAIVMRYLLARARDQRKGGTKHLDAFKEDRHAWRTFQKICGRIPPEHLLPG